MDRHANSSDVWVRFFVGLAILLAGIAIALWTFQDYQVAAWLSLLAAVILSGRLLLLPLLGSDGLAEPTAARSGRWRRVLRPDGSELQVEF